MSRRAESISSAFDAALRECGLTIESLEGRAAMGRLAALELASYLGMRPARRALSIERHVALGFCARELIDTSELDDLG
jgi:hypothetical protein